MATKKRNLLPPLSAGGAAFLCTKYGEPFSADSIARVAEEGQIPFTKDSTGRRLFQSADVLEFIKQRRTRRKALKSRASRQGDV